MKALALALIVGLFGITTSLRADDAPAAAEQKTETTKVEKKSHKKGKKGHKKSESKVETKTETKSEAPATEAAPAPEAK